jgi:predicted nucleotidyltransferase
MGLFQTLEAEAGKRNLQFLVIGGLAVNFHGYSRDTADLDLLIEHDAHKAWLSLFAELGYNVFAEKGSFSQLSPPKQDAWPVDLMMVREPTFQSILNHSIKTEMFGAHVLVPSLEHLLMLKLHALKHSHIGRFEKDFLDVTNLVRVNKVDLTSESVRQMFLKYGNKELYEKVSRECAAGES